MNRPKIIINCAMSADGKIALPNKKQVRLSSEEDISRMYKLRNDTDAVLVGIGTILSDNPKLTVKERYIPTPHQPLRVILDGSCQTPHHALAVNDVAPTIIFTKKGKEKPFPQTNVEVSGCSTDSTGLLHLPEVLDVLKTRGVSTLLVEGGSTVIWNFLSQKLVDDLFIFISPTIIGGTQTPTVAGGSGVSGADELIPLKILSFSPLGNGILVHYQLIA